MRGIRNYLPLTAIILLLVFPAILMGFSESTEVLQISESVLISVLLFTVPVAIFHRNIRIYLYLLLPLIALTPLFLFSLHIFKVPPGFELIVFILQTNPREAREAIAPFLVVFIPFTILYVALYFLLARKIDHQLSLKWAACVSCVSFVLLAAFTYHENGLYYRTDQKMYSSDFFLAYQYPGSLLSGVNEARIFLGKNNLKRAETFSFKAVKNDTLKQRQVYVLIIGESSRYDRWQINGYHRPTSPALSSQKNLITFSDVVAGAHYTWVSVPQIITRAHPDNYDIQFREKSILKAFSESGFKTVWLSNQSDQDIFWSGSIILHAKTADVSIFSPTYSPNLEFEDVYDGRLLPLLDSMLSADNRNLFIVLHTMGNHWEYSRRYPEDFDLFKPSGKTQSINPPESTNRDAVLNSYDNSILYADFIIDNVIKIVNRSADIAAVTFISDHGEDLGDSHPGQLDFHFRPSAATLRVPLFIWTSDGYQASFYDKYENLKSNRSHKVGTENIFYTSADLANIGFNGLDSTKSLASRYFKSSPQKFYDDDKQARLFSQLK